MARSRKRRAKSSSRRKPRKPKWGSILWWLLPGCIVGLFLLSIALRHRSLPPPPPTPPKNPIRVEVLNGCGKIGLAGAITRELRRRGVDVVYTGNASEMNHEVTIIIDRGGGDPSVRHIGRLTGCKNYLSSRDGRQDRDITLIIGMDYEELFPDISENRDRWWLLP